MPSGGTRIVPLPVSIACPLEGTWPLAQVLGGVLTVGGAGAEGVGGGVLSGSGEGGAFGVTGASGVIVVTGGMVMMGSLSPAMSLLLPLWLPSLST